MPKLEPKNIQKELEQGLFWPVYWIYGSEQMKSRELLKRIRKAALGEKDEKASGGLFDFAEQVFDASQVTSSEVLDAALSPSLGGGLRLIVVRDAHLLKDADALSELFSPRAPKSELMSVSVFLSKDLDGRKKFSKALIEKAAVVPCEEVSEADREAWVQFLLKRRGMTLSGEKLLQLCLLDPWNLDVVDQELEKISLYSDQEADQAGQGAQTGGVGSRGSTEEFLDALFMRNLNRALPLVEAFADLPDESLPLLGLLAWNLRQLALLVSDREKGLKNAKLNPYVAERLQRWSRSWKLPELIRMQARVAGIDFGLKQTPLLPVGLWDSLVTEFCNARSVSP